MSQEQWTAYDGIATLLSTELNAMADDANVLSAAIDFTEAAKARKPWMDIEIYLPIIDWSAQVNPALYIWVLPTVDGTNYEDGDATPTSPARAPDKIVPLREANSAQRLVARFLLTTPAQAKILIGNRTGAALSGTLNTLRYQLYSREAL
jgi:hypothetical protein